MNPKPLVLVVLYAIAEMQHGVRGLLLIPIFTAGDGLVLVTEREARQLSNG